jgi:hypothetical protein
MPSMQHPPGPVVADHTPVLSNTKIRFNSFQIGTGNDINATKDPNSYPPVEALQPSAQGSSSHLQAGPPA